MNHHSIGPKYLQNNPNKIIQTQVINQIISRDLQAATAQFYEKSQQLRQERINLIINKVNFVVNYS